METRDLTEAKRKAFLNWFAQNVNNGRDSKFRNQAAFAEAAGIRSDEITRIKNQGKAVPKPIENFLYEKFNLVLGQEESIVGTKALFFTLEEQRQLVKRLLNLNFSQAMSQTKFKMIPENPKLTEPILYEVPDERFLPLIKQGKILNANKERVKDFSPYEGQMFIIVKQDGLHSGIVRGDQLVPLNKNYESVPLEGFLDSYKVDSLNVPISEII